MTRRWRRLGCRFSATLSFRPLVRRTAEKGQSAFSSGETAGGPLAFVLPSLDVQPILKPLFVTVVCLWSDWSLAAPTSRAVGCEPRFEGFSAANGFLWGRRWRCQARAENSGHSGGCRR
jgi:hypothetical protein